MRGIAKDVPRSADSSGTVGIILAYDKKPLSICNVYFVVKQYFHYGISNVAEVDLLIERSIAASPALNLSPRLESTIVSIYLKFQNNINLNTCEQLTVLYLHLEPIPVKW